MSSAKITLIGMQSYMKQYDKDLFELLTLPTGIDKETVTDNILLKGSEFEVIYSNPDLLHDAIGIFSNKWQRTFTKWVEALNIDYNPLENYDRIEDWTDTGTGKDTLNGLVNTVNNGGSNTTDGSTTNSTNEVSAYNTANFQNDSKVSGSTTGNSNTTNNFTGSETTTNTMDKTNNNIHTGRVHGNIGVTTSMQLLEAQLSIVEWNVIEHITDMFLQEFCILVY